MLYCASLWCNGIWTACWLTTCIGWWLDVSSTIKQQESQFCTVEQDVCVFPRFPVGRTVFVSFLFCLQRRTSCNGVLSVREHSPFDRTAVVVRASNSHRLSSDRIKTDDHPAIPPAEYLLFIKNTKPQSSLTPPSALHSWQESQVYI
jgi:hypothetical protein